MNTVTVVGNLTRDPELRYTPTGQALVKFGVAVNRSYTNRNGEKVEQTDFFTVNAWRSLAEDVSLCRSRPEPGFSSAGACKAAAGRRRTGRSAALWKSRRRKWPPRFGGPPRS
ncbi:MAG: single-strand DNA-binding protein [Actinomycetota bacterium]|nr:single-strand DNA-binding protein [Actinomycetota bacterium]